MRNMISALTLSPAIDKTVYIDGFRVDEVNKAQGCCQVPGSKGVNVARILRRAASSPSASALWWGRAAATWPTRCAPTA